MDMPPDLTWSEEETFMGAKALSAGGVEPGSTQPWADTLGPKQTNDIMKKIPETK